ncbi:hypothetical protein IF2G_06825 [Cordyceps javanica]|nr:hypothetical protein IF2G_06825 [Cordyceps javanica]
MSASLLGQRSACPERNFVAGPNLLTGRHITSSLFEITSSSLRHWSHEQQISRRRASQSLACGHFGLASLGHKPGVVAEPKVPAGFQFGPKC